MVKCTFERGYIHTHIDYHFVIVESIMSISQESVSYDSPSSSSSLSEFSGSTPSYGTDGDVDEEVRAPIQIDVHCEVVAKENQPVPVQLVKNISHTVVEMARTKQTAKKTGYTRVSGEVWWKREREGQGQGCQATGPPNCRCRGSPSQM